MDPRWMMLALLTACASAAPTTTTPFDGSASQNACAPIDAASLMNCRSYGDPEPELSVSPSDEDVSRLLQGDDCWELATLAQNAAAVAPALVRIATNRGFAGHRAIIALGELRCAALHDDIASHLHAADPIRRMHAVRALGKALEDQAVARVAPLLADSDQGVIEAAVDVLAEIKSAEATSALRSFVAKSPPRWLADRATRALASR